MKKITFILIALITGTTFAQNSATASAVPAEAVIVSPITLVQTAGTKLNFGMIAADATGGTVVLSPANSRSGDAKIVTASITSVPDFNITGQDGYSYTVTLPADLEIKLVGPITSEAMNLTSFNSSLTDNKGIISGASNPFSVGATLNVNNDQDAGTYNGTFDVTVAYD